MAIPTGAGGAPRPALTPGTPESSPAAPFPSDRVLPARRVGRTRLGTDLTATALLRRLLPVAVLMVFTAGCDDRLGPSHRPPPPLDPALVADGRDRKSTRLNSSHVKISYAVFCLKKKKQHI